MMKDYAIPVANRFRTHRKSFRSYFQANLDMPLLIAIAALSITANASGLISGQAPAVLHTFRDGVGIQVPGGRRTPIQVDPVQYDLIQGKLGRPKAGDKVGSATWNEIRANDQGVFSGGATRGGYLRFEYVSDSERVVFLDAAGSSVSYVNGEPRGGDPYLYGWLSLPVQLKKGINEFLFVAGRGSFRAQLSTPNKPISWDPRDLTLPDFRESDDTQMWGAMVVRNATAIDATDLTVEALPSSGNPVRTRAWRIPALSVRKVGFMLDSRRPGAWKLRLLRGKEVLDETTIDIRRRSVEQSFKRTFQSGIDGSIQYYAVQPSKSRDREQALVLSLHGASVEAIGQADAYGPKSWANIVAPTNRRPFGFDWEEIGRLDALEVLELSRRQFDADPSRVYLTGHSMGGHGTWQIGAHYPDRFAAIAPSAGWISFQTYAGGVSYTNPTGVESILERAMSPSLTLMLKENYKQQGVYVLHGDADDNVPVTQARQMREHLSGHPDLQWFEQKGAGHWWDADEKEPGADCVDWRPMFEMFSRRRIPRIDEVRHIEFTTVSPGISSKCHWATIDQQVEPFWTTRIDLKADPLRRHISGSTTNVRTLLVDSKCLYGVGKTTIEIDGQSLEFSGEESVLRLTNEGGVWIAGKKRVESEKGAQRNGGFKDIFRNRVIFVYGASGNAMENAWSKAKARYDAETFYYRGNGSVDVVSDTEFSRMASGGRNVLLYGNSDTNKAFAKLVDSRDFSIRRNELKVGDFTYRNDLGVVAIFPRKGSNTASVGIVGGTTLTGSKSCDRMPFFTSGAGFPDVLAIRPEMLRDGIKGVAAAGYFGLDWRTASGWWAFDRTGND